MDSVLWVAQVALAIGFLGAGISHATRRYQTTGRMAWILDVPTPLMTTIGVLEILGAIGLVVPWVTGIAPWLTPLAAIALVALMVLAAVFHSQRPGEGMNAVFNIVIGVVAAFIVWGRIDPLRF